jgi:hypothetical protein
VCPDPSAETPVIAREIPAGHRWSGPDPSPAPGDQPVPPDSIAEEIEALAALLANVVELTRSRAVYPEYIALIAEQARGYQSVRRALRGER